MKTLFRPSVPVLLLILALSGFYFAGLAHVPFHPDEATYLYMSADFDTLLSDPLALAWQPGQSADADPRVRYRAVDGPLLRFAIGAVRRLARLPALPVDWDWSATYTENQARGALPTAGLLLAGRLAAALLYPACLRLIYLAGRDLGGETAGWLACLLLGTDALVLLHTRRAMAEGPLLFGVCLAIWALLRAHPRPALLAGSGALALSAKLSAAALLPALGLAALRLDALFPPGGPGKAGRLSIRIRGAVLSGSLFVAVCAGLTFALNPFYWRQPLPAFQAGWTARQTLLARQVAEFQHADPNQVLSSPPVRVLAMAAHLFILPPVVQDVGNYTAALQESSNRYLAAPLNDFARGLVFGGLRLTLSLAGFGLLTVGSRKVAPILRRKRAWFILAGLSLAAGLLISVPLPFQRYWLPLVPFTSICTALGLSGLLRRVRALPVWAAIFPSSTHPR